MGMERLLSVAEFQVPEDSFVYFAYLGDQAKRESLRLARVLRSEGIECLIEFKDRGMKAHFSRANRLGADWVLIIGEDELKKGKYQLKDMVNSRQFEGSALELVGIIKGKKILEIG